MNDENSTKNKEPGRLKKCAGYLAGLGLILGLYFGAKECNNDETTESANNNKATIENIVEDKNEQKPTTKRKNQGKSSLNWKRIKDYFFALNVLEVEASPHERVMECIDQVYPDLILKLAVEKDGGESYYIQLNNEPFVIRVTEGFATFYIDNPSWRDYIHTNRYSFTEVNDIEEYVKVAFLYICGNDFNSEEDQRRNYFRECIMWSGAHYYIATELAKIIDNLKFQISLEEKNFKQQSDNPTLSEELETKRELRREYEEQFLMHTDLYITEETEKENPDDYAIKNLQDARAWVYKDLGLYRDAALDFYAAGSIGYAARTAFEAEDYGLSLDILLSDLNDTVDLPSRKYHFFMLIKNAPELQTEIFQEIKERFGQEIFDKFTDDMNEYQKIFGE